jgi:hypothetical protein
LPDHVVANYIQADVRAGRADPGTIVGLSLCAPLRLLFSRANGALAGPNGLPVNVHEPVALRLRPAIGKSSRPFAGPPLR